MGGEPYEYVVDYEKDIGSALEKLRQRIFQTGEFRGSDMNPRDPEEAVRMMRESGTASILDITGLSAEPDYCCAAPLDKDELLEYFGTTEPTVEMVLESDELWADLERGQARYVITYEGGTPAKIVFIGYSFD